MSFTVPSNGFRLEGAALRNSYVAGRDVSNAVTSLEASVTDQQRQINELRAEKDELAARLASLEAWATRLTTTSE